MDQGGFQARVPCTALCECRYRVETTAIPVLQSRFRIPIREVQRPAFTDAVYAFLLELVQAAPAREKRAPLLQTLDRG